MSCKIEELERCDANVEVKIEVCASRLEKVESKSKESGRKEGSETE
jgi:hypothetical protein